MRDRQRGRINTERSVEAHIATLGRVSAGAFSEIFTKDII